MADADAGGAQAMDFHLVKVDAVRQPGPRAEPADALQVVDGAHAEALRAELLLVQRLGQVGMQAHVASLGQLGAGAHDVGGHRERRAGREGDLDLRAVAAFVVALDQPLAVSEDRFGILHHALAGQAAVLLGQVHRAARQHGAHAQFAHGLDLDVDRLLEPGGEQVVVVGGGGAARQQQLGQCHLARQFQRPRCEAGPDRVERQQPVEQRLVDHRTPGAGEGLVEVVMGVYQSRQHDVLVGIEGFVDRLRGHGPGGK
ncbi:hypothetical protein SSTU70S_01687 [Stutzerimonas stutzeri]